ncbi:hypothetical protein [Pigmentiphaga sp.]|uniref:hypothetical protein n=1 Tax=Pigmentiphaga sp. TaxID=1977564 RepID=UPI00128D9678|nr:hypothetical protein [Pigmentiphaga sp.]MPS29544.1 hypothetical protein [Alcaligenaceae bacterium SAGV5]MPS54675.1 hypothetical protein [Alcaligenaceae bacterium SAGV3]MPT56952.1 hypothetical protein [Alcaligenaceae bacterium]
MLRKNLSTALYFLSLVISVGGTIFVIAIHWPLLIAGKGIGSFSALFIAEYVVVSALLWLIGRVLERRKWLDWAYWLATVIPVVMVIVLPVKFYIE